MISTGMIILLQWFRPLEERSENNWETFNEYGTLLFLLILMCMSDFVPDLEMRHDLGTTYIVCICLFTFTHLVAMFAGMFCSVRLHCKRCYARCKCCKRRPETQAPKKNELKQKKSDLDIIEEEEEEKEEGFVDEESQRGEGNEKLFIEENKIYVGP